MNKILALDIGGTSIRGSIVLHNKVLNYIKVQTPKEKKRFLQEINKLIEMLITKDVKGIGIACPGPLKDGIIKNPPNLPIKNFNLKGYLEKRFKKKVEIENDAQCVALSESRLGCKKKNFIILTLGTGIGGGIIINGKSYRGTGYGGELGHIMVNGNYMEKLWKETRKRAEKEFGEKLLIRDLVRMNNEKARTILEDASIYLGQGVASLINVFDPEIVILSGGLKESGNLLVDLIKKQVKKYSILPKDTPISWTKLEHPGILGASLLIK